ncbi:MAG: purine-nucleoside phosphorylase [Actinomycetota bacterium]|nr:purine-nucleoside phosphorylase [Actinomycetota bacterium]
MAATIHLHPTAPLADRVLLPGDPGRALLLAQELLESPRMFNHNRGLWGYSGTARDGAPLTIQSTGMGGPSAAIVISELAQLGARRLLRVGTCGGLDGSLELGALVIAEAALTGDGTSRVLAGSERVAATGTLLAALKAAADGAARAGLVVSTDLFYDPARREQSWAAAGALAIEMETATLFALAASSELEAGSVLIVSDRVLPDRVRIDPDALRQAELRLGQVALRALAIG